MSTIGLADYLQRNSLAQKDGTCALWRVYDSFYTPGFWVALASLARSKAIKFDQIAFVNGSRKGYSEAIGLPSALGDADRYPFERHNKGKKYSPLVLLESAEATDQATNVVNSCIRTICEGLEVDKFAGDLCEVVGDLHDNVWSHGKSTGFSMAQCWKKPYCENEYMFEFALADCGLGFLRELRRVGLTMQDDASAINWCIEKGHSSKLVRQVKEDDWEQRLPPDVMGNPMPGIGYVKESDNHHQGLGLAKLMSLVEGYHGELWIATGNAIFTLTADGIRGLQAPNFPWEGVSIACRFDTSAIRLSQKTEEADSATDMLIELLEE